MITIKKLNTKKGSILQGSQDYAFRNYERQKDSLCGRAGAVSDTRSELLCYDREVEYRTCAVCLSNLPVPGNKQYSDLIWLAWLTLDIQHNTCPLSHVGNSWLITLWRWCKHNGLGSNTYRGKKNKNPSGSINLLVYTSIYKNTQKLEIWNLNIISQARQPFPYTIVW